MRPQPRVRRGGCPARGEVGCRDEGVPATVAKGHLLADLTSATASRVDDPQPPREHSRAAAVREVPPWSAAGALYALAALARIRRSCAPGLLADLQVGLLQDASEAARPAVVQGGVPSAWCIPG